jgi:peptidoglycan hydrolase-like protein with peptidoglycan-binding domain
MTATSNTMIAKIFAALAVAGLVVSSFASFAPANAQTTTTTTTTTASVSFSRDLTIGSTGADVTALQNWLISKGFAIAAGATGYFGAQSQAALAKYQAANGISPAAGYFGPITRAKVNAGGSTSGGTGTGTGTGSGDLNGGEASLESYEGNDGDDDEVSEGQTGDVAEFSFDVEDGDVEIDRVDLTFTTTAAGAEEDEPWNTFDTITLLVNGEEVASEDVSDEDDWMENDSPYEFRFTGLDAVVEEGDEAVITVQVEVASSVDSASTDIDWTVYVADEGIRAMDGAGIDQYTGETTSETATFTVNEEGDGEELNISSSSEDPNAAVLMVEDDGTSDWYTIFAFELDAEEADIDLDQLGVNLYTSDDNVSDVINDVKVVIDGEEFDDFDWVSEAGTSASTTFDIDKDFTIEGDETVTVEYMVEFKSRITANYAEGATIAASTTGAFVTGEGADDVTASGSAVGETHTLRTTGINVTPDSESASAVSVDGSDNDYATYTMVVDVEAFDADAYISQTAGTAFTFQIEDASTGTVLGTSTATTSTISSSADTEGSSYRISENGSETFTFTVTLNPLAANEGSSYRLQLLTIVSGSSASTPTGTTFTATPASDYETNGVLIND